MPILAHFSERLLPFCNPVFGQVPSCPGTDILQFNIYNALFEINCFCNGFVRNFWVQRYRQDKRRYTVQFPANVCGNGCNALRLRRAKGTPKSPVLFWIREQGDKTHTYKSLSPDFFLLSQKNPLTQEQKFEAA